MVAEVIYSVNLLPWREHLLQRRKYLVIGIAVTTLFCCFSIIVTASYYQQSQRRFFTKQHEDNQQKIRWLQQRNSALSRIKKTHMRSFVVAESYELLLKLAQHNSELLQITHLAYHNAHWLLQGRTWRAEDVRQIQQLLPLWRLKTLKRGKDNEWHFSLIREDQKRE